ncbi:hypothetical protein NSK_005429 [Nannochloropsis salina CCMP1776]|uniref:Uncharacterized protein n=1 Tax=Nannochloropsis salina CCMP1776 TaxID=1027361 RepID=A0A4D9CYI9_9STRA|nr:hypothetical protein NSK_005429 [Nannochloropsis salina CCMP1776]|eukprot:TFJ83267.1 hypothetical protein NSK_005429 [Nannochloropsis salina CCMP1776]
MDDTKMDINIGLHEDLLSQYDILSRELSPRLRRGLNDVYEGLEWMITLGALGVGFYTASRLLYATYWVLDCRSRKSTRWRKQVLALSFGSVMVGCACTAGVTIARTGMIRRRGA